MKKSCVGKDSDINYSGILSSNTTCLTIVIDRIQTEVHYESEI
jgi:hypothetical protein